MENTRATIREIIPTMKITDWHTHILPEMDDGSKSVAESLDLLKLSCLQGVSTVVLTPHFYPHKESPASFFRRRERAERLLDDAVFECDREAGQRPSRILGAEVYYFHELASMEDKDLLRLCIAQTNMLMIEMPESVWEESAFLCLEKLLYERQIIPLIAHIDRYYKSVSDYERLQRLIEEGLRVQLNADILLNPFSRKRALRWIDEGFVHLIGSDCHNMNVRKPNIGKAFDVLQKSFGRERALMLFHV